MQDTSPCRYEKRRIDHKRNQKEPDPQWRLTVSSVNPSRGFPHNIIENSANILIMKPRREVILPNFPFASRRSLLRLIFGLEATLVGEWLNLPQVLR